MDLLFIAMMACWIGAWSILIGLGLRYGIPAVLEELRMRRKEREEDQR